jgi:hypothetical protein
MKYSIEETTLTNIGDALRRKHGETKKVTVTEEKEYSSRVSKTSNATGFDSFEGAYVIENGELLDTVTIEGASRIHVKMAYQTTNKTYAYVQVSKGSNVSTGSVKYGGSTLTVVELDFDNTNTVTFRFFNAAPNTNYLGYYAEITGYDAQGNVLSGIVEVEKEVEVPNTYSSAEMAEAIDNIEVGESLPEEAFVLTENCSNMFRAGNWDWFLNMYGERITTKDLMASDFMFGDSKVDSIPFELNYKGDSSYACNSMFAGCTELKTIGKFKNLYPASMDNIFLNCRNLRYLPEFENMNFNRLYTYASTNVSNMFCGCYSLRSIPEDFLNKIYSPLMTSYFYSFLYQGFRYCYVLDEIRGLNPQTGKITSNLFANTFGECTRVKDIIFALNDNVPYSVNWSSQTLDLSKNVGYTDSTVHILDFNSGITEDKRVTDDATYQALKNDPDWWTTLTSYSRYNHDSAVNTINSLPDVTAGSGNTIKFLGSAGSNTDGGAINTLTEEEISVAASRGWTVSLV